MNAKVREVGEFKKWKELWNGDRISVTITVYEIKNELKTVYLLEDTLGRLCADLQENKAEVMEWLKDKGYKTAHKFYTEECGMSEETWKAWNSEEE